MTDTRSRPERVPACWMALCEETSGSLFAHTEARAKERGKEAYAPHPFVVMPLYPQEDK